MIAKPEKFKAIVLAKEKQNIDSFEINISGKPIFPTDSIDLLGIPIGNRLNFEKHIITFQNFCINLATSPVTRYYLGTTFWVN